MYLELAESDNQLSARKKLTKRQKWTRAMAFVPGLTPIVAARIIKDKKRKKQDSVEVINPEIIPTATTGQRLKRTGRKERPKILHKSVETISPLAPEPMPEDMTQTIIPNDFSPEPELENIPSTTYLPSPIEPEVMVREDEFDFMPDQQFEEHISRHCPYLSEEDYMQLSSSRKQRKAEKHAAKMAKKEAKTDIKRARAEKKRSGKGTTFGDVIGGIKDVAGSAMDVIGAVKGKKGGEETEVEVQQSFFDKNKGLIIGGVAILVIGGFLLTRKSGKN